jgi:PKHD-type hydroxylase
MIKDVHARRLTFDMDNALQQLVGRLGRNDAEVRKLTNIYHNLVPCWAEL